MSDFLIRPDVESALDLHLKGTSGAFKIGSDGEKRNSIEVKYLLTHVGLDFETGKDVLLDYIAPFREVFPIEELDFGEIMQRDLDDARVSTELIGNYLLDADSRELLKLFPPIVIALLPIKQDDVIPSHYYPKVQFSSKDISQDTEKENTFKHYITSGSPGKEIFQFEQVKVPEFEKPLEHEYVSLHINTRRTRLVIVDGQHRAMALLALYRNMKGGWDHARRRSYQRYYEEWTRDYISQFQLGDINLPIMLCVFPDLDSDYQGDLHLVRATRNLFLTLNKNAKKVSESRNILLDDEDIISEFMRNCLSHIKDKDTLSDSYLKIYNVELDQSKDKNKVRNTMAFTGVNHLYYLIEHTLLDNGDFDGTRPISGDFKKREILNTWNFTKRLDADDLLGTAESKKLRRTLMSDDSRELLKESFIEKYGHFIVRTFEEFEPFRIHSRAALRQEKNVNNYADAQVYPILYEGQGIGRTFESYMTHLKEKLEREHYPELDEIYNKMNQTSKLVSQAEYNFKQIRAELYLEKVPTKTKFKDESGYIRNDFVAWLNEMYSDVFTSVAFQTAITSGFFLITEKAQDMGYIEEDISHEDIFTDYLSQLNSFFVPASKSGFKHLVATYKGELPDDIWKWNEIAPSNYTFRHVVYPGEMKPDEWPKHWYLFLEIWNPVNERMNSFCKEERKKCRSEIFADLYKRKIKTYCEENLIHEDMLTDEDRKTVNAECFNLLHSFVNHTSDQPLRKSDIET